MLGGSSLGVDAVEVADPEPVEGASAGSGATSGVEVAIIVTSGVEVPVISVPGSGFGFGFGIIITVEGISAGGSGKIFMTKGVELDCVGSG